MDDDRNRLEALRIHLYRDHHNTGAPDLTDEEAVERHDIVHAGPAGRDSHDQPERFHDWRWFGGVRDGPA
jgi:hypothetical protein